MDNNGIRNVFVGWLSEKAAETASSTLDFYRQTATSFLSYLGERAASPIGILTRKEILCYRAVLSSRLSAKTVNHRIKTLRMIFESAVRDRLIPENPARYIKAARDIGPSVRRPFSLPELRSILALADPEWESLIKFGLYTGQRLGDIVRFNWREVDLQRDIICFVASKTHRHMMIPIAGPLRDHIISWKSAQQQQGYNTGFCPVHPRAHSSLMRAGGRVGSLSNQFANLLARAGLRSKVSHLETGRGRSNRRIAHALSFHSLRHTAVSLLKDSGMPQAVVMEFIGHRGSEISWQYTHVGIAALRLAASSIPRL